MDNIFGLKTDGLQTIVNISHRVSALSRADKVIVLDKGRITEQGSPDELIALGGLYARTAALQSLSGANDG